MGDYVDLLTEEDYKRAEKYGVDRKNLYYRYEVRLWSKERAITTPVYKNNRKYSKELIEKAAKNGVNYSVLTDRLRKGMSEKLAATKPIESEWTDKEEQYLIDNNDKMTASELAARLNKTMGAICGKRHRLGLRKRK